MTQTHDDPELERAIAELYRGPLEDFIRRRDGLSKELRAAGKRESATAVKGLKKPSRTAWALNRAVLGDGGALETVITAVGETADAQTAGGDVRAAIAGLRTAVRDLAADAAAAAEDGGHGVEANVLSNALFAVLGDTEGFARLRRGRLTDVPEAGGLDLLTTLLTPVFVAAARAPAPSPPPPPKPAVDDSAARAEVRRTAAELAGARERFAAGQAALRAVEGRLEAAEARLREAEAEVRALRAQREGARQEAEAAASLQRAAEGASADAERRLDEARRRNG